MTSTCGLIVVVAVLLAGSARAQTTGEGAAGFGVGALSNGISFGPVIQLGAGGEAVMNHRLGVGGDVLLGGGGRDAWIETSFKASYRFPVSSSDRYKPFVTGGYSLIGALRGVNIGGGVTRWYGHEGVRFEVRDVIVNIGLRTVQYWTAGVGLSFR